jgi:2-polyprenyl-6-hydroxyphenyl methylase / 3-demethylubiquinone-9 3-methyltransferase
MTTLPTESLPREATGSGKGNDLALYDTLAEQWWAPAGPFAALAQLNGPRFQFFDKHLPSWQGLQVLDAGCGGGLASEELAKRGAAVTGIDISLPSLEVAKAHAKSSGLAIRYQQASCEELPFPAESFDVVFCCDVLEHVNQPARVVHEGARVLKPGGLFFFDTFNRNPLARWITITLLENLLGQIPKGTHDSQKYIKPQEMRIWLEENSLALLSLSGFLPVGLSFSKRSPLLVPWGPPLVLYAGAARKGKSV